MIEKIIKYLGYVVFAAATVMCLYYFIGGSQAGALESSLAEANNLDSASKQFAVAEIASNWGAGVINFAIILLALSACLAILFAVVKFVTDFIDSPKKGLKSLAVLVGIFGIVFISYSLASSEIPNFLGVEKFNVTVSMSKWVDTGIFVTYTFLGLAVLGAIFSEISNIWK